MFIVVDTETTGLDPAEDKIVEIAGAWPNPRIPEQPKFSHTLCNPGRDIPPQSKAVHHITENDVIGKPKPGEGWGQILSSSSGEKPDILVAHNLKFDIGFLLPLDANLSEWDHICTWRCAMHLWPEAPSHSNQVLRYWLNLDPWLPTGLYPHRALYDTLVTYAVFTRMLEICSIEKLIELTTAPVMLETVRFGKHRGTQWKDVPRDYLEWLNRQAELDADVRHTVQKLLK